MNYKKTKEFAEILDKEDPLASYQGQFHFPYQSNGKKHIYLCGNSLGLQSKKTSDLILLWLKKTGSDTAANNPNNTKNSLPALSLLLFS